MCGLFGFSSYGEEHKNLSDLTNSLAQQSAIRGTDATGIAFCSDGAINVIKDSQSAYKLDFKHPDKIGAVLGHTRHSTQGSERKNFNNHPFFGKCKNARFALAHNGVLTNDKELRKSLKLPKTKIETDSFVAVQLIESQKLLSFDSIRYMAEKTNGSFSYSILDDKNNIWLVKGDSPLSIIHFPKHKMYVYASTDEILYKALVDYPLLFDAIKKGEYEPISISAGDIFKITPSGVIEKGGFSYNYYYGKGWWEYGYSSYAKSGEYTTDDYINELKVIAMYNGYSSEIVDEMLDVGFSLEDVEEYIYSGGEI